MDGLWVTHFDAGAAHGNGIALFRAGEILGGDFSHTWTGTYEEEGANLYARIRVASHRVGEQPEIPEPAVMMTLAGSRSGNSAVLTGHPDGREVPVTIEMHRAQEEPSALGRSPE